ncbi:MAG: ribosome-recycling factor [Patescibacteria group bacterium]
MYDLSAINKKGAEMKDWFKKEIGSLRTGRATPALMENIFVDVYGSKSLVKQVASITVEDAKTLRITPWDVSLLKNIENALMNANFGSNPIVDKQSVSISLPQLTEERRKALVKIVNEKLEQAKISLKVERDELWRDIQEKERKGIITEDEKFRLKDKLQKELAKINDELTEIAVRKEEEIMS